MAEIELTDVRIGNDFKVIIEVLNPAGEVTDMTNEKFKFIFKDNYDNSYIALFNGVDRINNKIEEGKVKVIFENYPLTAGIVKLSTYFAQADTEFKDNEWNLGYDTIIPIRLTNEYTRCNGVVVPCVVEYPTPTCLSTTAIFSKGDKGDKGIQGERGIQGIQGIQGEKGLQGDVGAKGDKGDSGYTPIKGIDYYTTADKTEIINDVKNGISIPTKTSELTNDSDFVDEGGLNAEVLILNTKIDAKADQTALDATNTNVTNLASEIVKKLTLPTNPYFDGMVITKVGGENKWLYPQHQDIMNCNSPGFSPIEYDENTGEYIFYRKYVYDSEPYYRMNYEQVLRSYHSTARIIDATDVPKAYKASLKHTVNFPFNAIDWMGSSFSIDFLTYVSNLENFFIPHTDKDKGEYSTFKKVNSATNAFGNLLKSIKYLDFKVFPENKYSSVFSNTYGVREKLVELKIYNLKYSLLINSFAINISDESINYIIANRASTLTTNPVVKDDFNPITLTFAQAVFNRLSQATKDLATSKNVTLAVI